MDEKDNDNEFNFENEIDLNEKKNENIFSLDDTIKKDQVKKDSNICPECLKRKVTQFVVECNVRICDDCAIENYFDGDYTIVEIDKEEQDNNDKVINVQSNDIDEFVFNMKGLSSKVDQKVQKENKPILSSFSSSKSISSFKNKKIKENNEAFETVMNLTTKKKKKKSTTTTRSKNKVKIIKKKIR